MTVRTLNSSFLKKQKFKNLSTAHVNEIASKT